MSIDKIEVSFASFEGALDRLRELRDQFNACGVVLKVAPLSLKEGRVQTELSKLGEQTAEETLFVCARELSGLS